MEYKDVEKVFIDINGLKQGMFIKGNNKDNPVLLFIHGGPGMPEYFLEEKYPVGLEKYFNVVFWEQRGCGLSYNQYLSQNEIVARNIISDLREVACYLKMYFKKRKIYLMGHSWGTFIAMQAADLYPELFEAYIGVGQEVNNHESERRNYKYMLDYYESEHNNKILKKLKKYNVLDSEEELEKYIKDPIRDKAMHLAGIGTMHNMKSVFKGIFLPVMKCKGYSIDEKINIWIAKSKINKAGFLFEDRNKLDLSKVIRRLKIPVYFMSGKYDYTVNRDLAKEYFDMIEAPVKGFYTFQNSAHSPMFEEREKFVKIMIEDVLNNKTALADKIKEKR